MNIFAKLAVAASVALIPVAAHAHHSFSATFKEDARITIEGTVTKFSFKNPHILLYLDVTNDDGTVTEWVSEGSAATLMRRAGWDSDTITEGMTVRVFGDSTHDGSPMTSLERVDVVDPATGAVIYELSRGNMRPAYDEGGPVTILGELSPGVVNVSGAWAARLRNSNFRPGPPDLKMSELGAAHQEAYQLSTDPQVFCDQPSIVRQVGVTPHPFMITQLEDRVVFEYEEYGGYREVFFDDRAALGIKSHFGDSVARYEGDALIVETTNILGNVSSPEGNWISDQATSVETYTRIDDPENGAVLFLEMVVTDPLYLTEPVVLTQTKTLVEGYEMIENDCQPPLRERSVVSPYTSFFLTSVGVGDGANLGGLEGADAHCQALAESVGVGGRDWKAYLSTTGDAGVNARDRIGAGPWYNSKGVPIALDVEQLHGDAPLLTRASNVFERGGQIPARDPGPNVHDILTGSDLEGRAIAGEEDSTCSNWTSNGEGSASVGHSDREGGGPNPTSWNNAHMSRGCSQANLEGTGGAGLFYCFAADPVEFAMTTVRVAETEEMLQRRRPGGMGAPPGEGGANGMGGPPPGEGGPDGMGGPPPAEGAAVEADDGQGNSFLMYGLLGLLIIVGGVIIFRRKSAE